MVEEEEGGLGEAGGGGGEGVGEGGGGRSRRRQETSAVLQERNVPSFQESDRKPFWEIGRGNFQNGKRVHAPLERSIQRHAV
ncbi:unnamed protein product, partial [Nesidiocoris tenuis]